MIIIQSIHRVRASNPALLFVKYRNPILEPMAKYKVKAFGITKDIVGGRETVVEVEGQTVAALRQSLQNTYPQLISLKSLFIAVNNAYAEEQSAISETDEIALIPPVSGG